MMKLSDLAKKANDLPYLNFEWGGAEHFHEEVFDREVRTLPEAIIYIRQLRERMASYSLILHELTEAYRKMRDVMLEAEVGE